MKLRRLSAIALLVLMAAVPPALAIDLTREQIRLLAQNPALTQLATQAPDVLAQALQIIAEVAGKPSDDQRGVEGLDPVDAQLLSDNPALLQVWHSSPEASADLLALIKIAAGGGGKPSK